MKYVAPPVGDSSVLLDTGTAPMVVSLNEPKQCVYDEQAHMQCSYDAGNGQRGLCGPCQRPDGTWTGGSGVDIG